MEANQLKLYSLSEAAKALCIGRDTLRDFMADGKIGYIILGKSRKITYMELMRFLTENTVRKVEAKESKTYSDLEVDKFFHKKNNISVSSLNGEDILNKIIRHENGNRVTKR